MKTTTQERDMTTFSIHHNAYTIDTNRKRVNGDIVIAPISSKRIKDAAIMYYLTTRTFKIVGITALERIAGYQLHAILTDAGLEKEMAA